MQDLLAGQIDLMIPQPSLALPQMTAGKIRAYAVTAASRLPSAPDIPSADEAGAPGLHVAIWHGLWAPKGTAPDIVAVLNTAVKQALADGKVRQRFAEIGQEIPPPEQQTPFALAEHQRTELAKWGPIIKAAGLKAE
jgi:tripartite-type tricarboxylate transporter receptor subunit TctC